MLGDFRKFVMRGNVVDLAVGVVIGAAFGAIVTSLVNDVLLPPIGLALGGADFTDLFLVLSAGEPGSPYATLAQAQEAGAVTLNYGVFLTRVVSFLIVAASIFLVVRAVERLRRVEEAPAAAPVTRDCPFCLSTIPIKATRCPHCTSEVQA
jgi:large conductance mechanosensitive channel